MKQEEAKRVAFGKVLIIDHLELDTFIDAELLKMYADVEKIYTRNKQKDALEWLATIKKPGDFPELILVNTFLPATGGVEFLKEFSKLPGKLRGKTKVVFLSAYYNLYDNMHLEAEKYPFWGGIIPKPIEEVFLQKIKKKMNTQK